MAKTGSTMMTALKWRDIAIQKIRAKLAKLKVHDTYELIRTIQMYVRQTGADSFTATLLYNYYGIFPDMGVGKGVKFGDTATAKLSGSKRRRKVWTREIAAQSHRFGEVLGKAMMEEGSREIIKIIPTIIKMKY